MRRWPLLAIAACAFLGGCEGAESAAPRTTVPPAAAAAGVVTANISSVGGPYLPSETADPAVARVVDLLYGRLVTIGQDGAPAGELAENVSSPDGQHFTVTLREGRSFASGEPVDAASFVNAWNYAAYGPNDAPAAAYFAPIEGFSDLQTLGDGETPAPKSEQMSGLAVVDARTFTISLTSPDADFVSRLALPAFAPLPASAIKDPVSFARSPDGAGPYRIASAASGRLDLAPNAAYEGDRKASNSGIRFQVFDTQLAAYQALQAGRLDVLDQVPQSERASMTALGDRIVNLPIASIRSLTIPDRLEHFSGEEGRLRRTAISVAIDRESIAAGALGDTASAAKDFTSPVLDGYSDEIKGVKNLGYDPERARRLWAKADEISPWTGAFTIAFNSDGGHAEWVGAVLADIARNLGIETSAQPYATAAELRDAVQARVIDVPFRTSWQAEYASAYDFLYPVYSSGAGGGMGFNDGDYASKDFDAALAAAAAAPSRGECLAGIASAQQILLRDLPSLPLFYDHGVAAHSKAVAGLDLAWDGTPIYSAIVK